MGYNTNDAIVRVDLFKQESMRWQHTIAVDMDRYFNEKTVYHAVEEAIVDYFKSSDCVLKPENGGPLTGYNYVCLEPFHAHPYPVSISF